MLPVYIVLNVSSLFSMGTELTPLLPTFNTGISLQFCNSRKTVCFLHAMDAHPHFGGLCWGACVAFILCHSSPESCHVSWELARTRSQAQFATPVSLSKCMSQYFGSALQPSVCRANWISAEWIYFRE